MPLNDHPSPAEARGAVCLLLARMVFGKKSGGRAHGSVQGRRGRLIITLCVAGSLRVHGSVRVSLGMRDSVRIPETLLGHRLVHEFLCFLDLRCRDILSDHGEVSTLNPMEGRGGPPPSSGSRYTDLNLRTLALRQCRPLIESVRCFLSGG